MSLKDDKMLATDGEGGSLPLLNARNPRQRRNTKTLAVHLLTTQSHTRGVLKECDMDNGSS